MIFFGKILLKTLYFFITNISELDFEEKKSAEIVLHPMHGGTPPSTSYFQQMTKITLLGGFLAESRQQFLQTRVFGF